MQLIIIFLLVAYQLTTAESMPKLTVNGTRTSCPDPGVEGVQCTEDCRSIGYCKENLWMILEICDPKYSCHPDLPNLGCQEALVCPYRWTDVQCIDTNISVPNLEDSTCTSYMHCGTSSLPNALVAGRMVKCPAGQFYDPCTEQCSQDVNCPKPITCTEDTVFTTLISNKRFAYACITLNGRRNIVWKDCKSGVFNQTIGECTHAGIYNCADCKEPGRFPIEGTNCSYRECESDLTYTNVSCKSGYHYDDKRKECVSGYCKNSNTK